MRHKYEQLSISRRQLGITTKNVHEKNLKVRNLILRRLEITGKSVAVEKLVSI